MHAFGDQDEVLDVDSENENLEGVLRRLETRGNCLDRHLVMLNKASTRL